VLFFLTTLFQLIDLPQHFLFITINTVEKLGMRSGWMLRLVSRATTRVKASTLFHTVP
jgi:hypothetical protein